MKIKASSEIDMWRRGAQRERRRASECVSMMALTDDAVSANGLQEMARAARQRATRFEGWATTDDDDE